MVKGWKKTVWLTGVLACCACASSGAKYHDRTMDFGSIKTVAVMPFWNLTRDSMAGDRVRDVFVTMLLSSQSVYVVPTGEVSRALSRASVASLATPSNEEVTKVGQSLKADAIITGVVKEYGELHAGSAAGGNIISVSVQMQEVSTGKIVWAASTTKGGIPLSNRLLGGNGDPMNRVTEQAVDDLLEKLFK